MKRIASFVIAALMMTSTEAGSIKQLVAETIEKNCPG